MVAVRDDGGEFNLASGQETRIADLAEMINRATGNSTGIRFAQRCRWDTKSRLPACVDKARELIGYEPNTPFEVGLDNTIRWFCEHWDQIEDSVSFGPGGVVGAGYSEVRLWS